VINVGTQRPFLAMSLGSSWTILHQKKLAPPPSLVRSDC